MMISQGGHDVLRMDFDHITTKQRKVRFEDELVSTVHRRLSFSSMDVGHLFKGQTSYSFRNLSLSRKGHLS